MFPKPEEKDESSETGEKSETFAVFLLMWMLEFRPINKIKDFWFGLWSSTIGSHGEC